MNRCTKVRYRDEIASTQHKDGSRREKAEQRAYRCPLCRGWHLTSRPRRRTR